MVDQPKQDQSDVLRRYLANHDAPCPGCGYNLRGVETTKCPECGMALWLPLRTTRRGIGWAIGLVGAICAYAQFAFVAITLVFGNYFYGAFALLIVLDAPFRLRRWVRTRRAFAGLPRHIQQQMVAGWWLAALLASFLVWASVSRHP